MDTDKNKMKNKNVKVPKPFDVSVFVYYLTNIAASPDNDLKNRSGCAN
jgi:hypothetical protein